MTAAVPVPIDQRFAQLIQQFGLTKNSFAISLGKTASVVQHLIEGRNKPGYDLLCKVFEIYPNVSRDWLLLGRGPMLVSGGPTPKAPALPVVVAPELPLEPIDLSDIEAPAHRRSGPGVAGTRLQPEEIAATLALAAAAAQPARASAAVPLETTASSEKTASEGNEMAAPPTPLVATGPEAPSIPDAPAARSSVPAERTPPMRPEPAPPLPAPATSLAPETYVVAALHAQHLQHQLALAELRNQHLVEQQQMLREMLAMARQAMV